MRDALKSYLALAGGVSEVTRQRALAAAKALVAQGEATAEQVTSLAEDLLSQSRQNREAVVALVGYEVDRALGRVGLATADEVAALTERVRVLESQVGAGAGGSVGGRSPATTAPPAKKAQPAKKSPAKESSGAKGGADKSSAANGGADKSSAAKGGSDKSSPTKAGS